VYAGRRPAPLGGVPAVAALAAEQQVFEAIQFLSDGLHGGFVLLEPGFVLLYRSLVPHNGALLDLEPLLLLFDALLMAQRHSVRYYKRIPKLLHHLFQRHAIHSSYYASTAQHYLSEFR